MGVPKGAFWLVITFFAGGDQRGSPTPSDGKGALYLFRTEYRLEQLMCLDIEKKTLAWFSQLLGGRGEARSESSVLVAPSLTPKKIGDRAPESTWSNCSCDLARCSPPW